jgi:hypothetical protein
MDNPSFHFQENRGSDSDLLGDKVRIAMIEQLSKEIDDRLKELAREYFQTPMESPRRPEIANEISALCLRRSIAKEVLSQDWWPR